MRFTFDDFEEGHRRLAEGPVVRHGEPGRPIASVLRLAGQACRARVPTATVSAFTFTFLIAAIAAGLALLPAALRS